MREEERGRDRKREGEREWIHYTVDLFSIRYFIIMQNKNKEMDKYELLD